MCGIAGVVGLDQPLDEADRRTVGRMLARLHHRGPDHTAQCDDGRVCFGHTRLRLIDPSPAADQPMRNDDDTCWLTYNGEVTNFRELEAKHRLRERYRFRSASDTETVLRLWESLGAAAPAEFSGQYAFALYDRRRRTVRLVRDPFGQRPLFYAQLPHRLYFASEIKALLAVPGLTRQLNPEGLYHYFALGYLPDEHTPFAAIRELPGGGALEIAVDSGTLTRHPPAGLDWRLNDRISYPEAVAGVRDRLADAVRRNLIADAPVGLTLSGGLDSSGLLALAHAQGASRGLHAFSLTFDEPDFDESRQQQVMVSRTGVAWHPVRVTPAAAHGVLRDHLLCLDEPTGNGGVIPSLLLARAAAPYVRALLSGEGGDEIFGGYATHGAAALRTLYRRWLPGPARAALRALCARLPESDQRLNLPFLLRRFTTGAELDPAAAHIHWRHALTDAQQRACLPGWHDVPPTADLFRARFAASAGRDDLTRLTRLDLELYLFGDLMPKNDRTMMACSIEARFPYLDLPLVAFAAALPAAYKVRRAGFSRRRVQKRALAPLLPRSILRHRKLGLELPYARWFRGPWRALGEEYFSPGRLARPGIFATAAVGQLWAEHQRGRADHGRALWTIFTFLLWHELFVESDAAGSVSAA